MKKDIHPEVYPVCFVDVGTGTKFFTYSTLKTKVKEVIDGVEYYISNREVTSASHPAIQEKSVLSVVPKVVFKNSIINLVVVALKELN